MEQGGGQALVVGLPGDPGRQELVDEGAAAPVAGAAVAVDPERVAGHQGEVVRQRRVGDRVVAGQQGAPGGQPVQERRLAGADDLGELVVLLHHQHDVGRGRPGDGAPRPRRPAADRDRRPGGRMVWLLDPLGQLRDDQRRGDEDGQQRPAELALHRILRVDLARGGAWSGPVFPADMNPR
ncbi:MAG TPA: hypothetical protein VGR74_09790 [Actinomycetota bacterium]|nr:hypothetical protein [Actinomycetota bacterium]